MQKTKIKSIHRVDKEITEQKKKLVPASFFLMLFITNNGEFKQRQQSKIFFLQSYFSIKYLSIFCFRPY